MNLGITPQNDLTLLNMENKEEIELTTLLELNEENLLKFRPPISIIKTSPTDTTNTHGDYRNNWNKNNEKIIDRWLNTVNQNSYIYDRVSDIYLSKHSKIQIILLLFNSLLAVISYLQFNSNSETEITIYKYLIMIFSSIVALIVNVQRIKKYETKANNYSSISLELSSLTLIILSQIEIPYDMRKDFKIYLPEIRQKYYALLSKLPNMDEKEYSRSFKAYTEFNGMKCKQNFRHQIANDKNKNLELQMMCNDRVIIDIESP